MRYVMSDIHGEYGLFMRLMEKIGFCSGDELYVCGDMVDKGSQSIKLLKQLFSMPNAVCILGNHEYAFLQYCNAVMRSSPNAFEEAAEQLRSYFPSPDGKLLDGHTLKRLMALPAYYECADFICVHAGLPVSRTGEVTPPQKANTVFMVNDRNFNSPKLLPDTAKCVFFGHTPTRYINNADKIIAYSRGGAVGGIADLIKVHLDTGVYLSGVLGCFCVDNLREFYVRRTP